jgi:putative ABC transport system permease protein
MRSMLVAPNGERQLVELKAVDPRWPLVGAPDLAPPQRMAEAIGQHRLLTEQLVLDRLGVHLGDTVRLGTASFRISGLLTHEPDRVATAAILGPRVLIADSDLASTGLISPGAMVRYAIRLTAADPAALAAAIPKAFPNQGWRIRDPHDAAPGVNRFIDQIALFLTLRGYSDRIDRGIAAAAAGG